MNYFTKLCRLCTSHKDVSITLNHWGSDNITYYDKLNEIAPGILELNNELPNGICAICIVQLNDSYQFKSKCLASQEFYKHYLTQLRNGAATEMKQRNEEEAINAEKNNECSNQNEQIKSNSAIVENKNIDYLQLCENNKIFIKTEISEEFFDEEEETTSEINEINLNFDKDINNSEATDCDYSKTETIIENELCGNFKSETTEESSDNTEHIGNNADHMSTENCTESFSGNSELKLHRNPTNTNAKRYKCEICNKSFNFSSNLKEHIRIHTNSRPFKCDICGKTFIQNQHLVRHSRTHSNERPYACEICGIAFAERGNLKKHVRTHTNSKPHECEICRKTFGEAFNLKRHYMSHSNLKPYGCEICGKVFKHSDHLKRHTRSHIDAKP